MTSNEELIKEIKELNKKLDLLLEEQSKNSHNLNIPAACQNCSNHPINGGSGICHCILGMQNIVY